MFDFFYKTLIYFFERQKKKASLADAIQLYILSDDKDQAFVAFQAAYKKRFGKVVSQIVLDKLICSNLGAYQALDIYGNSTSLYLCDFNKGEIYKKTKKDIRFPYNAKRKDVVGSSCMDGVFAYFFALVGVLFLSAVIVSLLFILYKALWRFIPYLVLLDGMKKNHLVLLFGSIAFLPFFSCLFMVLCLNYEKQRRADVIMPVLMAEINAMENK